MLSLRRFRNCANLNAPLTLLPKPIRDQEISISHLYVEKINFFFKFIMNTILSKKLFYRSRFGLFLI